MSKSLPEQILVGGFIYRLEFTDFPDENQYNLAYVNSQNWPRKKVFMQYSESSRERCVKKAWKKLATTDKQWRTVS